MPPIQVVIRVRPLLNHQKDTENIISIEHQKQEGKPQKHRLKVLVDAYSQIRINFDKVLGPQTTQSEMFDVFTDKFSQMLKGNDITIFAYGQTGSGKTHTMFGHDWDTANGGNPKVQKTFMQGLEIDLKHAGIIPRAAFTVFKIQELQNKSCQIYCSFLQIYNEKIYDLMKDENSKFKPLPIYQSKSQGIFVEGLSEFQVNHYKDCLELLQFGQKNRFIRQTSMNSKSSRSHTIFQIIVQNINNKQEKKMISRTKVNLCDLAGSEKINKKQVMKSAQLEQLKNINLSLTTLGRVIYSLSVHQKITCFRDSKLTRLLQKSLTVNTKSFIIGNVSASSKQVDETVNTLKFVERAMHIVMKVEMIDNIKSSDLPANFGSKGLAVHMAQEMEYLKELMHIKNKSSPNEEKYLSRIQYLEAENQKLRQKVEDSDELANLISRNQEMKEQIGMLRDLLAEKKKKIDIEAEEHSQDDLQDYSKVNNTMKFYAKLEALKRKDASKQLKKKKKSRFAVVGQSTLVQNNLQLKNIQPYISSPIVQETTKKGFQTDQIFPNNEKSQVNNQNKKRFSQSVEMSKIKRTNIQKNDYQGKIRELQSRLRQS